MNIIKFDFKGHQVGFNNDGWINATEAAKKFGKKPAKWLELPSTGSYIDALAKALGFDVRKSDFELVKTTRGGAKSGTWFHPKLAVAFARWLSDDFGVWCDLQIDKLIRSQKVSYTDEQVMAILTHRKPQSWDKKFQDPFYQALSKMTSLPFNNHIGGCPALFGLITQKWVYGIVLPKFVYKSIKDKLNKGDKIHQYLKPEALKSVEDQLIAITTIAKGCIDYKDFEARCSTIFNIQGQMKFILAA
ncbi:KilA-N domain-containing protein [Orbus sturtevantii]|uniref:KilA-N domain-containing protein n=1 Tax=Orbus sturtevantii TaxID=3074109 RepID=UPI00370D5A0B